MQKFRNDTKWAAIVAICQLWLLASCTDIAEPCEAVGCGLQAFDLPAGAGQVQCVGMPTEASGCASVHESLSSALSAVPPGGAIALGPGIWTESLVITKPVALIGHPSGTYIAPNQTGDVSANPGITINVSGTVVVRDIGVFGAIGYGIGVLGGNVWLERVLVTETAFGQSAAGSEMPGHGIVAATLSDQALTRVVLSGGTKSSQNAGIGLIAFKATVVAISFEAEENYGGGVALVEAPPMLAGDWIVDPYILPNPRSIVDPYIMEGAASIVDPYITVSPCAGTDARQTPVTPSETGDLPALLLGGGLKRNNGFGLALIGTSAWVDSLVVDDTRSYPSSGTGGDGVLFSTMNSSAGANAIFGVQVELKSNRRAGLVIDQTITESNAGVLPNRVSFLGAAVKNSRGGIWVAGEGSALEVCEGAEISDNLLVGIDARNGASLQISGGSVMRTRLAPVAPSVRAQGGGVDTQAGDGIVVAGGASLAMQNAEVLGHERVGLLVHNPSGTQFSITNSAIGASEFGISFQDLPVDKTWALPQNGSEGLEVEVPGKPTSAVVEGENLPLGSLCGGGESSAPCTAPVLNAVIDAAVSEL